MVPGVVHDLSAAALSADRIRLYFSAPAAVDADAPAKEFVIKQSRTPILDIASFDAGRTLCDGMCRFNPSAVGEELTLDVGRLTANTTYYYALRVANSSGVLGPISNPAEVTTLAPCPVAPSAGAGQVTYGSGYHLVSVPAGTSLPAPVLYGWFNRGSGRYSLHDAGSAESGHGYWAWFACPSRVDLAQTGTSDVSTPLAGYHASLVGNPSSGSNATLSGHDFAATWDADANDGSGAYRISGFREPQPLDLGEAAWAFAYKDTELVIRTR